MGDTITVRVECEACDATGLYVGFAERDGAAVVCHKCKGSGCKVLTGRPFTGRREREGVTRVYQANVGYVIGCSEQDGIALEDYGGMPHAQWARGSEFPHGSEDRKHCCPAYWLQNVRGRNADRQWCISTPGFRFDECDRYADKAECWARYDEDFVAGREVD